MHWNVSLSHNKRNPSGAIILYTEQGHAHWDYRRQSPYTQSMRTYAAKFWHAYEQLELKEYQKEKFAQLTHTDSRTLQATCKRVPNRVERAKSTTLLPRLCIWKEEVATPQRQLDNDRARGVYTTNIHAILVHAPVYINRWRGRLFSTSLRTTIRLSLCCFKNVRPQ